MPTASISDLVALRQIQGEGQIVELFRLYVFLDVDRRRRDSGTAEIVKQSCVLLHSREAKLFYGNNYKDDSMELLQQKKEVKVSIE